MIQIVLENDQNVSRFSIPNRKFHRYERSYSYDYMTVVNYQGKVICESYRMEPNYSYIVTEDNQVIQQNYGDGNLFMDRYGNEH